MEHKSFNTPLIMHNTPANHTPRKYTHAYAHTYITKAVGMLIQGRRVINTCGFGPENTESD